MYGNLLHDVGEIFRAHGHTLGLVLAEEQHKHQLYMHSQTLPMGEYEAYEYLTIQFHSDALQQIEKDPLLFKKRLLVNNKGIFTLTFPVGTQVTNLEVYGLNLKNKISEDEDFPDERELISADVDFLFKFSTNQNFFFTWGGRESAMFLEVYKNDQEELFDHFIAETQEHWGAFSAFQFKYGLL